MKKETVTLRNSPLYLLELFDRIYYCAFSFIMKSPSRDMPHVMSSIMITFMIFINLVMLLAFIESKASMQITFRSAKLIIIFIYILLSLLTLYYYVWKKNGERIVKHYKIKMGAKSSVVIGYIMFFESLFLPIIIGFISRFAR